jgi:type VI secretion system protein ImpC
MAKKDWRSEVRLAANMNTTEHACAHALDPDRPFGIVVLGDFSGEMADGDTAPEPRAYPIDVDSFDSVVTRCGPRWRGSLRGLPDRPGEEIAIEVAFAEIDDFHPDRLLHRIAPLRALLDTRRALADPQRGARVADEIAAWAGVDAEGASAEPNRRAAAPPASDPADLLAQIVAEASNEPSVVPVRRDDLQRFVESVVGPHVVATDRAGQRACIEAVDRVLTQQLRSILHDPGFQRLEAAWRGLRWLVRRIGGEPQVPIRVVSLPQRRLGADAVAGAALSESFLERVVCAPREARPALLVGNYEFGGDDASVHALRHLGSIALSAGARFVGGAACALLGCESFVAMPAAQSLARRFAAPECEAWRTLRRSAAAPGLALALPRFLGRLPYGPETEPIESFDFVEIVGAGEHGELLWLNPAFAVAAVAAAGFCAQGWQTDIATEAQQIDDLPLYVYTDAGSPVTKPCAEVLLTDVQLEALGHAGLLPLASVPNRDAVVLPCVQTLAEPRAALAWAAAAGAL